MKERKGKFGQFYGCTAYPACKNTMNMDTANAEITEQLGARPNDEWIDSYGAGGDYDPGGDYD